MIKICLCGLGRAGIQIAKYLLTRKDVKVVSACSSEKSKKIGKDLGEILNCRDTGIIVQTPECIKPELESSFPDVVIDFSSPSAALKNTELFSKMKRNIVMGTTGFTENEEKKLFSIVKKYKNGLIYAPNITRGVNVLMFLTELASRLLDNYDIEIIEMHHKYKKDKPSGTAQKINQVIKSCSSNIENTAISSVRAGGIVGYHKVIMAGEYDKLEISHESFSRQAFAEGALYATKFINNKKGIYKMKDMFNFEEILWDYFSQKQEQEQGIIYSRINNFKANSMLKINKQIEKSSI